MYSRATTGVVAGKFLPFHKGHEALIKHATQVADLVHVFVVAKDDDIYDPRIRAMAIYESFPYSNLKVHVIDDIFTDDNKAISSKYWAQYTMQILGYYPGVVVASEPYGETWAQEMGAEFIVHDVARTSIPISGTMCRANAYECREYLPQASKRFTLPRIVIVGAESTGTTTLAKALAEHYDTRWVPEFGHQLVLDDLAAGRDVSDAAWDDQRFILTSRGQDAAEEREARHANGLLICDTSSWATYVWYKYYMLKPEANVSGNIKYKLLDWGKRQAKKHALYILTDDLGVPFEDDGTRTGEYLRGWMTREFKLDLKNLGVEYVTVRGSKQERLDLAINWIDKVIT